MSRYRKSEMDFDYSGTAPQSQRWDASRFSRESQHRAAPVIEERPPYQAPRRGDTYYDEEQDYYERDVRGPRGEFRERRYFEEDDYYDPRAGTGAMVPFRPERPSRPAAPPRPRMVRRQSSVDRIDFDRRQSRRYYDDYQPPPPPPPPEYRRPRQESRHYYDDVRVSDPDYYGDDGFREYREREWIRTRSRNDSPSPDRRAPTAASVRSSRHSEFVEAAPPEEERIEEHFEEVKEEKVVEKPYPRRGKTRMPRRLVHTKVLFELGYSFYEEDEKTIIITKALGPDNIDEVFSKSKELFEAQGTTTTKLLEAPPTPASRSFSVAESVHTKRLSEAPQSVREWDNIVDRSPSPGSSVSQATRKSGRRSRSQGTRRESIHESFHEDIHVDDRRSVAPSRISRGPSRHDSVHESFHEDFHIDDRKSVAPSRVSRGPSRRGSVHESFHEDVHKTERISISPARTAQTGRSSRRSRSHARSRRSRSTSASGTTIIERRKTIVEDGGIGVFEESNPIDIGPLSLVRTHNRTDADIQAEILDLERERRDVRRDTETVRYESRSRRESDPLRLEILRSPSPRGEIIVADRVTGDDVRVRKDKRAARSRSRPPGPGLLKSMMYTVT